MAIRPALFTEVHGIVLPAIEPMVTEIAALFELIRTLDERVRCIVSKKSSDATIPLTDVSAVGKFGRLAATSRTH